MFPYPSYVADLVAKTNRWLVASIREENYADNYVEIQGKFVEEMWQLALKDGF